MGAKRDEVGKTRRALAKALGEAGYDVDPQHIRQMSSTRSYRPLARWQWEVVARRRLDGAMVTIRSWDTMGACVRRGIEDPAASVVVQARGAMLDRVANDMTHAVATLDAAMTEARVVATVPAEPELALPRGGRPRRRLKAGP